MTVTDGSYTTPRCLLTALYLHREQACDLHCFSGFLYNCVATMHLCCTCSKMQIQKPQVTNLCKANGAHKTFVLMFVFTCFMCSWMEPWIWTRGASSVQPSGSWGGGRSRTWRPLWPARDSGPHASNSRRTRRTSTGKTTHTNTHKHTLKLQRSIDPTATFHSSSGKQG